MAVCPNCGTESPDTFKFCPSCATPLDQAPQPQVEERKVVSVLFVDLVGFTARSHDLDPEDIHAVLAPYHRLLKTEIERIGGTVEKFIGDAVMAVFGAPVAHEDDAERAVRAALRITEAISELNESTPNLDLSIRAAVDTGKGLVNLSARPQAGEGMVTGDVVNTASRLQGIAPVGGVAVGEVTYRSTKEAIVYEDMEPVGVKGKPEPLPVWRAISARSRFGVDVETRYRTPFIGREIDLTLLKTTYQRALREASLQLVTVAGEPGVGKSRLVSEFWSYIDEQPELITWRQGRSLPYGEGITFWALGEIVKAQAGINESDSPEVATGKLAKTIAAVLSDESDRTWLLDRLAPLVGATKAGGSNADKEESFTAWLRFLEAIATTGPVVLVFEDLHWADEPMLEFIEHLVEWSTGVPIFVMCTARPELFEKHPTWGAGTRNAASISLSPLADSEVAQLISGLLSQAVLPADIHISLLERAGGNPLYAEEFIRMLSDRGVLRHRGRVLTLDADADIPLPDNIQALIAARLDTLSVDRKALLHNAAVVGKVFWSGAVTAMGGADEPTVRQGLHELVRKELVRPVRASSIAHQQELTFWHALVRDVAYAQIPRAARARKHQAAAQWIEGIASERVNDHAEVLAHHYGLALELVAHSDDQTDGAALRCSTRRFRVMAGDRAFHLDVPRALTWYQAALALSPAGEPERGEILYKLGNVCDEMGAYDEARLHFESSISEFRATGDAVGEAKAMVRASDVRWRQGAGDQSGSVHLAIQLLEDQAPNPHLSYAYGRMAVAQWRLGLFQEALSWSERALASAKSSDSKSDLIGALNRKGFILTELGDASGIALLQEALDLSLEIEDSTWIAINYLNLGSCICDSKSPTEALPIVQTGVDFSHDHGMSSSEMFGKTQLIVIYFGIGDWDRAWEITDEVRTWGEQHGDRQVEMLALSVKAMVLVRRGKLREAEELLEALSTAPELEDLQSVVPAYVASALIRSALGQHSKAVGLVEELQNVTRDSPVWRARHLPEIMHVAVTAGRLSLAEELVIDPGDVHTRDARHALVTGHAILAEAKGNVEQARNCYLEAAHQWEDYGFVLEEGQAQLGLARCLIALGDHEAATDPLQKARAIFLRLGARPLFDEVDRHLGQATALSS